MRRTSGILFSGCALAPIALSAAGWPGAAQRLESVLAAAGHGSLRAAEKPRSGALGPDGYVDVVLRQPGRYVVAGACDARCQDIDLWVFGANGRVVARSVDDQASPVLEVEVHSGAMLRARVQMVACEAQACDAAVGAFR